MFTAWQTARLSGQGKLKPLDHYLKELEPARAVPRRQSPDEMKAAFDAWIAQGAPIKVRKLEG